MMDMDEIIDYIKTLKRGFDKDLFQNKIDELAYAVDTTGIHYNDFHTLFKVWLNLSIPITKWVSLGVCLVPRDNIEDRTVEYALSWLLSSYHDQSTFSRIGFLLDWLTAAMECACVDKNKLALGYEAFYVCLTYEALTPHAMKLVYTLTKPSDVTRRRVLEVLAHAKKREGKKNMYRQLQVLLGLFKSYKPECVPENVPAISIHTAFKKINANLMERFKRNQECRNSLNKENISITWINPINSARGRNCKVNPLVPNMEFLNMGSRKDPNKEIQQNFLDFTDPVSVMQCGLQKSSNRPARLRALLCNGTGVALLAVASQADLAFLSHDLHNLLNNCFLEISPHSYAEKQDLLHRLAVLQHTLMQGIPVITTFLTQYLPLWNEKDYFPEILELAQWVSVDSPDHVMFIVEPMTRIYHRAQSMEQCAILKCLTNLYSNLLRSSRRAPAQFPGAAPAQTLLAAAPLVNSAVARMCDKALQVDPDDMVVLQSSMFSAEVRALSGALNAAAEEVGNCVQAVAPLSLTLSLVSCSALLIDNAASLMMLYINIFSKLKKSNKLQRDDKFCSEQMRILQGYTTDMTNCLYTEEMLSARETGFVFQKLHPQLVSKLRNLLSHVDSMLSLRNSLAFAPYTYVEHNAIDYRDADNKLWFNAVIDQEFPNLSRFLKKVLPELQYK